MGKNLHIPFFEDHGARSQQAAEEVMRERRVSSLLLLLLLMTVFVTFMSGVNTARNELNFIFNGMISSEGTEEPNPLFDNGTPLGQLEHFKGITLRSFLQKHVQQYVTIRQNRTTLDQEGTSIMG